MVKLTSEKVTTYLKSTVHELPKSSVTFIKDRFPFIQWLPKYNRTWLFGDLIAGLTVGMLVIPQALAYAKLAGLPLEHGLYTSFVGLISYFLFATSKDVTIGATAVMSQLSGQLMATYNVNTGLSPVVFSVSLAFFAGLVETFIGLFQLGIIVDLIPTPVIAGFTTGAGVQIITGQLQGLLGIPGINTNNAAYQVLIDTVGSIGKLRFDAVIGLSSLALLIIFRLSTYYFVSKGHKWFQWVGQAANGVTVILFIIISYFVNNGLAPKDLKFRIVGNIPRGLNYFDVPSFEDFPKVAPAIGSVVLVGILEQIAVAKSFGRINGYRPNANQEIVAVGLVNTIGSLFGGFSATGSFSRSSIKSRSGARTPLSGVFTAIVVLLAIYVITPVFQFIPNATLAAIIINSISDLLSRPATIRELWEIEVFDFLSFLIALLATIFSSIENGIFTSVAFALIVLLYRVARPNVHALVRDESGGWIGYEEIKQENEIVSVKSSPPGVAVFRVEESLTYPNANYVSDNVKSWIQANTKYNGQNKETSEKLWCEDTVNEAKVSSAYLPVWFDDTQNPVNEIPILNAVVFDFASVNNIDSTGLQTLVDIRADLEKYAGGHISFYFAHVRPHHQHILDYFYELGSKHDVVPVVHSDVWLDGSSSSDINELRKGRIFRTIDQAVAAASKKNSIASLSDTVSVGSKEGSKSFL
ncbi:sulfate transporter family-domain-containing protein [Globomyces pollinis-pini]|nr:sulfate transporter family-domain-containing protein [Globomyces pollinis-pini]